MISSHQLGVNSFQAWPQPVTGQDGGTRTLPLLCLTQGSSKGLSGLELPVGLAFVRSASQGLTAPPSWSCFLPFPFTDITPTKSSGLLIPLRYLLCWGLTVSFLHNLCSARPTPNTQGVFAQRVCPSPTIWASGHSEARMLCNCGPCQSIFLWGTEEKIAGRALAISGQHSSSRPALELQVFPWDVSAGMRWRNVPWPLLKYFMFL